MHKKIRNRINVLRIFIKTVVGGKNYVFTVFSAATQRSTTPSNL